MSKPRLLDLFCGAGGAAVGYARAGFEVVGVDIKPQPHYPFEFHQGDALEMLAMGGIGRDNRTGRCAYGLDQFAVIHASPPCQAYTRLRHLPWLRDKERWDSIPPTIAALQDAGLPWVLENVEDSHIDGVLLCGTMFDLGWPDGTPLYRHRLFASSEFLMAPGGHPTHTQTLVPGRLLKGRARLNNGYVVGAHQNGLRAKGAMDIDWMTGSELSQAIPPAYTQWLGEHLLRAWRIWSPGPEGGETRARFPTLRSCAPSSMTWTPWSRPPARYANSAKPSTTSERSERASAA